MGRTIPLDTIPDSNTAPVGTYRFAVDELTETTSKKGKYQIILDATIVDPAEYNDISVREWLTIGTDDDPDALDPAGKAWRSISARQFKQFLAACGYPLSQFDMDDIVQAIPGTEFVAAIGLQEASDAGPERNVFKKFFMPGTADVNNGAAPAPRPTAAPAPRVAAPPAARPAAPPARPTAPAPRAAAPTAPGRPAPRPAPRQAAQPAQAPADDAETAAETRATPAAAPTKRARRSAPKSGSGTGASRIGVRMTWDGGELESRAFRGDKPNHVVDLVECAICNEMIPRADFQAHVRDHP